MSVHFEAGQQLLVIPIIGKHVDDQRRKTDEAQGCSGIQGTIKAVGDPITKDAQRASIEIIGAVMNTVQKLLNSDRILQL
jgi:hypothetical protein